MTRKKIEPAKVLLNQKKIEDIINRFQSPALVDGGVDGTVVCGAFANIASIFATGAVQVKGLLSAAGVQFEEEFEGRKKPSATNTDTTVTFKLNAKQFEVFCAYLRSQETGPGSPGGKSR